MSAWAITFNTLTARLLKVNPHALMSVHYARLDYASVVWHCGNRITTYNIQRTCGSLASNIERFQSFAFFLIEKHSATHNNETHSSKRPTTNGRLATLGNNSNLILLIFLSTFLNIHFSILNNLAISICYCYCSVSESFAYDKPRLFCTLQRTQKTINMCHRLSKSSVLF